MHKRWTTAILTGLLLALFVALAAAIEPGPEMMGMGGMMGPQHRGMMTDGAPCPNAPCMNSPDAMPPMPMMHGDMAGMMGGQRMHGMMAQRMEHAFYLDQAEELGLSDKQVAQLKQIRSDCQKENIRAAAEARIVRLDLADLLDGDGWSLDQAEPLVRQLEKLQGNIQLRHLQALLDARKVLSDEQLKKARSLQAGELEMLFE